MKFEFGADVPRPIDQKFWIFHLFLPLGVAILVLLLLGQTGIDLWLADRWYALEGHQWAWRDNWLTYGVIHHDGKELLLSVGLILGILLACSYQIPKMRHWREPIAYLLTSMVLLPLLIATTKHFSTAPCPWDLARYGGSVIYQHKLGFSAASNAAGHCFPAGHASGGFALLALYFAAYRNARFPFAWLLPGLGVGFIFAFGQEARGAHFLSHDLWSLSLCWFGALGLYVLFRPQSWFQVRAWSRPVYATAQSAGISR